MGCLKLTYQNFESPLKVVYKNLSFEQNNAQRFLSVDPLTGNFPWYTPYQFAGNSPIMAIDLDGLELKTVIHSVDQHSDGSFFVKATFVGIIKEYSEEINGQAHSRTDVITIYKGEVISTKHLYEPINALQPTRVNYPASLVGV